MDRIEQLLAQLAPDVARAFREAIQTIVDDVVLADLIAALEANDVARAYQVLNIDPPVYNPMLDMLRNVFARGGQAAMFMLPKRVDVAEGVSTVLRFNIRDKRAEDWLAHQSSTLVTKISEDARAAVRDGLQQGVAEGRNPRSIALDLVGRIDPQTGRRTGGSVGLSEREQMWVRGYRQRLLTLDIGYFELKLRDKRFDGVVRKAIESGKPLPAATVDKLVDRYREAALRARGENIGRTETLASLNQSDYLAMRQAAEKVGVSAGQITKEWDTAGDTHVRHSHAEMDGQIRTLDEPFESPVTGAKMMHPGDSTLGASIGDIAGCRCRVRYRMPRNWRILKERSLGGTV